MAQVLAVELLTDSRCTDGGQLGHLRADQVFPHGHVPRRLARDPGVDVHPVLGRLGLRHPQGSRWTAPRRPGRRWRRRPALHGQARPRTRARPPRRRLSGAGQPRHSQASSVSSCRHGTANPAKAAPGPLLVRKSSYGERQTSRSALRCTDQSHLSAHHRLRVGGLVVWRCCCRAWRATAGAAARHASASGRPPAPTRGSAAAGASRQRRRPGAPQPVPWRSTSPARSTHAWS